MVVLYDVEQRLFQLLLPTRRLGSVHPVPIAAGRRSDSFLFPFFFFSSSTDQDREIRQLREFLRS